MAAESVVKCRRVMCAEIVQELPALILYIFSVSFAVQLCVCVSVWKCEREGLQLALSADDGSQKGSKGPTQLVVAASGKLMHFSAAAATTAATK